MSNRIHNVVIGLSGVQQVQPMLPAAGVNAFMVCSFFIAGEFASSTNLELLCARASCFLGWKGEDKRIQMGIIGAKCMQIPIAQDHAGQIGKELPKAEYQARLDSMHAGFLLAQQAI